MVSKVLSIKHHHECNFCYHAFSMLLLYFSLFDMIYHIYFMKH